MYDYKATLIRVVDGDTVDVLLDKGMDDYRKCRLRLFGVNAPEMHDKNAVARDEARAARDFLIAALPTGEKALIVETHKDRTEKFGRYLATVYAVGSTVSVNDALVSKGLAVPYMLDA